MILIWRRKRTAVYQSAAVAQAVDPWAAHRMFDGYERWRVA